MGPAATRPVVAAGRRLGAGPVDLDRRPPGGGAAPVTRPGALTAPVPSASFAAGAMMLSGSLAAFEGSALSLPPIASLDESEDPVEPGTKAPEAVLVPAPTPPA